MREAPGSIPGISTFFSPPFFFIFSTASSRKYNSMQSERFNFFINYIEDMYHNNPG